MRWVFSMRLRAGGGEAEAAHDEKGVVEVGFGGVALDYPAHEEAEEGDLFIEALELGAVEVVELAPLEAAGVEAVLESVEIVRLGAGGLAGGGGRCVHGDIIAHMFYFCKGRKERWGLFFWKAGEGEQAAEGSAWRGRAEVGQEMKEECLFRLGGDSPPNQLPSNLKTEQSEQPVEKPGDDGNPDGGNEGPGEPVYFETGQEAGAQEQDDCGHYQEDDKPQKAATQGNPQKTQQPEDDRGYDRDDDRGDNGAPEAIDREPQVQAADDHENHSGCYQGDQKTYKDTHYSSSMKKR